MPGSHGGSPRVEASPHRNRIKDRRPAFSFIHSFIHCKINLLNFQVDGVLLASELKLKAEFQEEEHASTTATESIICPCLTMSPVSHSHSASPPTQPSNLFTLKFFPNLHRAIGGPSCPGATADLPASKLPHTATASKIDDQHSHSFIHSL